MDRWMDVNVFLNDNVTKIVKILKEAVWLYAIS